MKFSLLFAALSFSVSAFAVSGNNLSRSSTHLLRGTKQLVGETISCVCSGMYKVGDRVRLLVDHPDGSEALMTGHEGTVVSGAQGAPPLLVSWDDFTAGHNGNAITECPKTILPDTSGWYVTCEDLEMMRPSPSTGVSACLTNATAREAIMQQPGVLTVVQTMQNSCFNFPNPVAGKPYSITINGDL